MNAMQPGFLSQAICRSFHCLHLRVHYVVFQTRNDQYLVSWGPSCGVIKYKMYENNNINNK